MATDLPIAPDGATDGGDLDVTDVPTDTGSPDAEDVPTTDAPTTDVPTDVAPDAPSPMACRSDRDCSVRAQVCERTRGLCVDCLTTVDCTGTDVCSSNRCVAAPPPCRSDRDCSGRMQVCNATRMTCVDCNTDRDCPTGNVCDPEGNCAPQTCVPAAVSCADERTRRVCSSDGRMFTATACPTVVNGTSRCADGVCAPTCDASFADCDGSAANGCEVDLRVAATNCGRCGNVCPAAGGTASCAAGACALTCSAGRGDCDGSAANGCETNTASSNAHCGRCGVACGAGQTCTDGVCALSSCPSGQTRCGAVCVDLNTTVEQCGACGRACSVPNATAACAGGTCTVGRCAVGFGDCDGAPANGCETAVTTSLSHCGACGNACPSPPNATPRCAASACGFTCAAGFSDCDGASSNGCETSLATSAANCGACGRACAVGQVCQAGTCATSSCPAGQAVCTGTACRDITSDPANCGACGRTCATGDVCLSSSCLSTPLRFNLSWNVSADLDIAVVTPGGTVINYQTRSGGGGTLAADSTTTGPELVYWSATPPAGTYSVCVIPYRVTGATSYTLQAFRAGAVSATRTGSWTTSAPSGTACSATSPYKVLDLVY